MHGQAVRFCILNRTLLGGLRDLRGLKELVDHTTEAALAPHAVKITGEDRPVSFSRCKAGLRF